MDNLAIYEKVRNVPNEAKKPISAGRLKGMTDINPMWRIKVLTECFGACGVGWWYEITDKKLVPDENTNQTAAFVDILLYYVDPESGNVSHGIPGTGGASFVAQERNGAYLSDECFKMALTDAISVASKALGVGADVYWDKDSTKYSDSAPQDEPKTPPQDDNYIYRCENCGEVVKGYITENGTVIGVRRHANGSQKKYGKVLCLPCIEKRNTETGESR